MAPVGFALTDEEEEIRQAQEDFAQEQLDHQARDAQSNADAEARYEEIQAQQARDEIDAANRDVTDERIKSNENVNIEVLENSPEVKAAVEQLDAAWNDYDQAHANAAAAEGDYKNAQDRLANADEDLFLAQVAAENADFGDVEPAQALRDAQKALDEAKKDVETISQEVETAKAAESAATARVQDLEGARDRALDAYYKNKKSILPQTNKSITDCKARMNEVSMDSQTAKDKFKARDDEYIQDVLGCGIKTGDIRLWMVPYYVRFILEFLLQIAGLIAVGGIIYGSYLYMFAGVSDEKDRGKKAIAYGVAGIIVAMVAWAVVNIVISFLTG